MKLKLFTAIAVLAGLAMASGTPEKGKGKKHRQHPGIKQLIEKFDKDGDGKLNAEERKAAGEAIRNRAGRRPAHGKPGNRPTRRQRPQGKPEGKPERPEGRPERPERPAGKPKKK